MKDQLHCSVSGHFYFRSGSDARHECKRKTDGDLNLTVMQAPPAALAALQSQTASV